ncbi:hypothetical protein [Candidatus Parabeggiatoa sp. HSG14]|uniref:hypothetical protein n=1 Tax=Candidatus Parabeggiatoa sp. HSG14 TaxID=3055593 RepID=UPI0025A6C134|nr:hypothetical protein [Thiotrichales bacterium HSG14]
MEFILIIVLDTHIWLWWINQTSKLKTIWLEHIEQAEQVSVSAISLFVVSWLHRHNRIELTAHVMRSYRRERCPPKRSAIGK